MAWKWWLTVFLLIASGCSQDSPVKRATATASWSATAALWGQEWIRGAVPTAYAEDAVQKKRESGLDITVIIFAP